MVADVQHLAPVPIPRGVGHIFRVKDGQERVAQRLEQLGNECRADGARRVAAAQRQRAPPPVHRQVRQRQQVAAQIEQVAQVIAPAQARRGGGYEPLDLIKRFAQALVNIS